MGSRARHLYSYVLLIAMFTRSAAFVPIHKASHPVRSRLDAISGDQLAELLAALEAEKAAAVAVEDFLTAAEIKGEIEAVRGSGKQTHIHETQSHIREIEAQWETDPDDGDAIPGGGVESDPYAWMQDEILRDQAAHERFVEKNPGLMSDGGAGTMLR